ncbi:MAG: hypothetical protein WCF57_21795 [Pyrinomonadaceae bacterium]
MRNIQRIGLPFITLGIAFLVIGLSGQRTFIYVGIPFFILGIIALTRGNR